MRAERLLAALLLTGCAALGGCSAMGKDRSHQGDLVTVRTPPPPSYRERALADFHEASALAAQLRFDEAEARFSQLLAILEAAEEHDKVAETLFWLGLCNEKQGRAQRAEEFYGRAIQGYPASHAARMAGDRLEGLRSPATAPSSAPASALGPAGGS